MKDMPRKDGLWQPFGGGGELQRFNIFNIFLVTEVLWLPKVEIWGFTDGIWGID